MIFATRCRFPCVMTNVQFDLLICFSNTQEEKMCTKKKKYHVPTYDSVAIPFYPIVELHIRLVDVRNLLRKVILLVPFI